MPPYLLTSSPELFSDMNCQEGKIIHGVSTSYLLIDFFLTMFLTSLRISVPWNRTDFENAKLVCIIIDASCVHAGNEVGNVFRGESISRKSVMEHYREGTSHWRSRPNGQ